MDENLYWLALRRGPGCGNLEQLFKHFKRPSGLFNGTGAQWSHAGISEKLQQYLRASDLQQAKADLEWLLQSDFQLVSYLDPAYPEQLKRISSPPLLLFVFGDVDVLSFPQIAIVGSRSPTPGGRENAFEFARFLASKGFVINSGLARGVDGSAHLGAIQANGGTIAVMGTGPDRIYPADHRDLAYQIAENGAVVTEFMPGSHASRSHFPQRNRIISGMSLGTLVVEAARKSGSLITARLASEQGREVFAIPGSIHNPLARGCHDLIRQGAKLVESGEHILEEVGPLLSETPRQNSEPFEEQPPSPDSEYLPLLEQMGWDPVTVDKLVERSGLTAEAVSSMLLILELDGIIAAHSSGTYVRNK